MRWIPVAASLAFAPFATAAPPAPVPDAELLEFLAEWTAEDGRPVDPFETQSPDEESDGTGESKHEHDGK